MADQHPITPPPELVREWMERTEYDEHTWFYESYIAEQAARWGADQELEACCEWLEQNCGRWDLPAALRVARRAGGRPGRAAAGRGAAMTTIDPNQSTCISAAMSDTLTINGIDYVRADSVPAAQPNGNRAVVVVDRGWIFAGDVTREDGRIKLSRAVWVFRWESCGFAAVIENPSKADIRPMADVDIPAGAEIFCVPVHDQWGL